MNTLFCEIRELKQLQIFPTITNDFREYWMAKTIFLKYKIDRLRYLTQNWDSYNADPISIGAIELSIILVEKLSANNISIDFITPLRNGGVQLEKSFNNNDIEIEVHPNNTLILLIFDKDANCLEETDYNLFNVSKLIRKLKSLDG